ncbi:hypothetical protein [Butyrivibrio sp. INlla21]|uniref:hypothetical protein n=1 Tax=Butyrivibrio sp. INlla21 TaxID=1520811 RepID=UPI0008EDBCCE|nr:hypothetical protein [Butyrivibrio sp. INlla21]SFU99260.1 hypothetical protein SAMN02910342_02810 [Butyrivibrio sp. INlla21]
MDNKAFDSRRIAEGYAKRPWLHKSVMDMLWKDLGLADDHRFKNGLDVGCGAGLSTMASLLSTISASRIRWWETLPTISGTTKSI